jgi:hypothetical protein
MPEINKTNLIDAQGNLIPINIELIESSGPVSPPYQFYLEIAIKNEGSGLRMQYSYKGKFIAGEPEEKKNIDELIPKDKSIKILESLLDLNALGINVELSEDVKNNVGISFNEFNLQIGAKDKTKILYTLGDLDEPNFELQTKIIEFVKKLDNWNSL